ncbi:RNA-dependent RNA polymerase 1 [Fagus crenata]
MVAKGVVAVDPTSSIKLSLRKSMCKIEFLKRGKGDIDQQCYVNRSVERTRGTRMDVPRESTKMYDGVFGETKTLKYGQVFVQISRTSRQHRNNFSLMCFAPAPQIGQFNFEGKEVQEYFTNCIVHDNKGIIDNAHTAFADKEGLGRLPKSGVAAEIPHHLRVKVYPDFVEKSDKPTYESKHVIGKLFELTALDYISDAFKYRSEYDYKLRNLMDYYKDRN